MAVFQLPTDGIADGAITTAKINASVSLGASVNVILDGTDGGGSNAGDNLILDGTDGAGANAAVPFDNRPFGVSISVQTQHGTDARPAKRRRLWWKAPYIDIFVCGEYVHVYIYLTH